MATGTTLASWSYLYDNLYRQTQQSFSGVGAAGATIPAQASATFWLSTGHEIPKYAAEQLIARLAWRGISGWPRAGEYGGPEHGDPEHGIAEHGEKRQ